MPQVQWEERSPDMIATWTPGTLVMLSWERRPRKVWRSADILVSRGFWNKLHNSGSQKNVKTSCQQGWFSLKALKECTSQHFPEKQDTGIDSHDYRGQYIPPSPTHKLETQVTFAVVQLESKGEQSLSPRTEENQCPSLAFMLKGWILHSSFFYSTQTIHTTESNLLHWAHRFEC